MNKKLSLSRKDSGRQRAIQRALASGKGLAGLLAGLAAATFAGGCNGLRPSATMGRFPAAPEQQPNAGNEFEEDWIAGDIVFPDETVEMPNAANEAKCAVPVLPGKLAPEQPNAGNEFEGGVTAGAPPLPLDTHPDGPGPLQLSSAPSAE